MRKITLEYKKKDIETPFETFLRYSKEKETSSELLAKLLRQNIYSKTVKILDVGAGNGEYLLMVLNKANFSCQIDLVSLEPSPDLILQLKKQIKKYPRNIKMTIIENSWENYKTEIKYDVIIASHLYHIPREEYYQQFKKMVDYLKSSGCLFFVMRSIDDPYEFKKKFKTLLFKNGYQPQTISETVEIFRKISKNRLRLDIQVFESVSPLYFPLKTNIGDSISIIEFYLNRYWQEIPLKIQEEIWEFIEKKNGVFKQIDAIALIKKVLK